MFNRCTNVRLKLSIILIVLLLFYPVLSDAGQFEVSKVIDGNTITVQDEGNKKVIVRLVGIDAPALPASKEKPGQPFSGRAAKHLASLVLGHVVDIKSYGLDGSGRMLGELFSDDKNINIEMIKAGYAEVYRGKLPAGLDVEAYWQAQKEAQKANRGMWVQGDKYVSPREWKK